MFANQLGTLTDHELETLCVPLKECLSVRTGAVDPCVLAELEARCYDQALVYPLDKNHLLGLVETQRLRTLHISAEPLVAEDLSVRDEGHRFHVGSFVTVGQVLERMSERRAVIVIRGSSATESGYVEWNYGLLTISDLNRQPFRAALYSPLAELESGMAVVVASHFHDPWEWVKTLGEEQQVRVRRYWKRAKRGGVDVGPIAAATLSQLLQVVAKNRDLLAKLGYESRADFEGHTGRIPELRNSVMHPVKPLVLDQDDVASVRQTVASVIALYRRVEKCIERSPWGDGGAQPAVVST